jgi:hypothetical protein
MIFHVLFCPSDQLAEGERSINYSDENENNDKRSPHNREGFGELIVEFLGDHTLNRLLANERSS